MGASVRPESRIEQTIKAMREQGADERDIETYLTDVEGIKPEAPGPRRLARPSVQPDATARRAPGTGTSGDFEATAPAVAANILSAVQGVPFLGKPIEGFEAFSGMLGSKFTDNPMDYSQSLAALRSETDAIPAPIKMAGQLAVGGLTTPKSLFSTVPKAMATGGSMGVANAVLDPDLDKGIGERSQDAAVQGSIGAVVPALAGGLTRGTEKAVKFGKLANRVRKSPSIGEELGTQKDAIKAADDVLYKASEAEAAAAGGTGPKVQALIKDPKFQGLVDDIRGESLFIGKPTDDASTLFQLHRELSQKQGPFIDKILGVRDAGGAAPITERQAQVLGKMKEMIREAVEEIAPSFPTAVAKHAEGMAGKEATKEGLRRGRNLMGDKTPGVKRVEADTPEATLRWGQSRTAEQAEDALPGVLAAGREAPKGMLRNAMFAGGGALPGFYIGGPAGAVTGAAVGAGVRTGARLNRIGPLVDALDTQAGNPVQNPLALENLLRALGLGTAGVTR